MVIKHSTAKRLIRAGKAVELGIVSHDGRQYMAMDRLDLQRTDHYVVMEAFTPPPFHIGNPIAAMIGR